MLLLHSATASYFTNLLLQVIYGCIVLCIVIRLFN